MTHESRLELEMRTLLNQRRVAALGTTRDDGAPFVSMVPYAIEPASASLVLHVSGLAAHTRQLMERPAVSLLVMQAEVAGEPVHALPRVTLEGAARVPARESDEWQACRSVYLERFPDAQLMTELPDFVFVAVTPSSARHISGFGAARSVDVPELQRVLGRRP